MIFRTRSFQRAAARSTVRLTLGSSRSTALGCSLLSFSLLCAGLAACSGADMGPEPQPQEIPDEPQDEDEEPAEPTERFLLSIETDKLPILQGTEETFWVRVERKNGLDFPRVDRLPADS